MAHQTFQMYAHITWHTWHRVACVDARAAREVRIAVLSAGKRTGVQVIRGKVLADHVHLLVSFRPDTRLCDFLRLAKSVSATRANRLVFGMVKWSRGYYVTTLHQNDLPRVTRYIDRQYERHPDLVPRGSRFSNPGRKPGVHNNADHPGGSSNPARCPAVYDVTHQDGFSNPGRKPGVHNNADHPGGSSNPGR